MTQQAISIFDMHHPPDRELIDDCVHCGFCLPTCPTYVLWGEEMDSPRGRIYLMKLGSDGAVALDQTTVQHFDSCLGCMACLTSCPSGVQYDKLIEATRSQIERNYQRDLPDGLFRRMIFELFPHPKRLKLIALPLWFYRRSGLRGLVHKLGILQWLPERLRALESLLPAYSLAAVDPAVAEVIPAHGERRMRVGMLLGCVQRVFYGDVNAATIRVLTAEGCEVVVPKTQGCCGALMVHAGQETHAVTMAKRMIDAFETADVEVVVINAAGCGSTLKEYGHLLRDDNEYAERAKRFSEKCKDISEMLTMLPARAERKPIPLTIAYHDACHLQHAQRIRNEPRQILRNIPGLQIVEIPEAAICCGSAGIYNLVEPGPAQQLGDRKVQHILTTGAQAIVSSNPGCLLQITSGLERAGKPLPTFHMIELIDASIRGTLPDRANTKVADYMIAD
jgi:glycolate oxidase iron-sulfur subunit